MPGMGLGTYRGQIRQDPRPSLGLHSGLQASEDSIEIVTQCEKILGKKNQQVVDRR